MSLFLCQLALINSDETDSLITFSQIVDELEKIECIKFGEHKHKINIKLVVDFSALWKLLRRKKFKVKDTSIKDKLELEFEMEENKEGENFLYEDHKGCPFCCASRKCSNKCSRNRNFLKKDSEQDCKQCYGRYNNFGAFEFNPDLFYFMNGLPAKSFIPCTIHLDKNVVVRLLQPFAKMSFQLTKGFELFNDSCNKIFGFGKVYAQ
jgi:hypothetical protein